jgi:hypothetical protein
LAIGGLIEFLDLALAVIEPLLKQAILLTESPNHVGDVVGHGKSAPTQCIKEVGYSVAWR